MRNGYDQYCLDFMNYKEFTNTIQRQISLMPIQQGLELAVDICKKLFFDYQKFSETYQWGEPDFLLDGIRVCEKALTQHPDTSVVKDLIQKIESVTPDMDDFGSMLGSYALNASASVWETLQYLLDFDKTHIMAVSTYYTDTIDFKIQEEGELGETEIDNHHLMVSARQFLLLATK
jgi:uncharacterized protein YjaG (DUF416 family)